MKDCEDEDLFWASLILPLKQKRKKESKSKRTKKPDEDMQKKTKKKKKKKMKMNPTFKDAVARRKAKKKDKKKKTGLVDSFILTQATGADAKPNLNPEPVSGGLGPDHLTQGGCKMKPEKKKTKKKVAFDLSQDYIRVKRPKFVSLSPKRPKGSVLLENEGVGLTCSQVLLSGPAPIDSQCTSEDMNSQDLFITQKTFRVSPIDPSSGETVSETPNSGSKQDSPEAQVRPAPFHHNHRKSDEEEERRLNKAHHEAKRRTSQTRLKVKADHHLERELLGSVQVKPAFNPYLADPLVLSPPPNPKKQSGVSHRQPITTSSTQTENFFSTKLSSYLGFCQNTRVTSHLDDLKPLDLSLPHRARKDLWRGSPPGEIKGHRQKYPDAHPSSSSGVRDVEVRREGADPHSWTVGPPGKDETTPSPESESEPKSADTTASSEENEPLFRSGKLDLTQVRAVQMRLNESFFFKTKGDGRSPRPESPLMKLAQGRDVKSRKSH